MHRKISILIIRLSSIGDVVLTTPLLRVLRNKYPEARIDFLTFDLMSDVLKHNPRINNLFTIKKSNIFNTYSQKKLINFSIDNYDYVIDLQNNIKSRVLRLGLSNSILSFDKRRFYKLQLVYLKRRFTTYRKIPDLYIETCRHLALKPDDKSPELWLNSDNEYNYEIKASNKNTIVIAPGAKHYTKRWPKEKFAELINKMHYHIPGINLILLGSPEDNEICSFIAENSNDRIINLCGKTTLLESAEIIDSSALVVTNDSAIMHIASARQVNVVAIFGSTVEQFGFVPYNAHFTIIQKDVECRPCTHYGKNKCPKKHFKCMNDITVEEVLTAITKNLNFKKLN